MKKTSLGSKTPKPNFFEEVKKDNKSRSARHENRLQGVLRSKVTPNSGALPDLSKKGDLRDELFVWQAKLTNKDRFTITSDIILELKRQASLTGKWPGICVTIESLPDNVDKDWVCIPSNIFAELIDNYRNKCQ